MCRQGVQNCGLSHVLRCFGGYRKKHVALIIRLSPAAAVCLVAHRLYARRPSSLIAQHADLAPPGTTPCAQLGVYWLLYGSYQRKWRDGAETSVCVYVSMCSSTRHNGQQQQLGMHWLCSPRERPPPRAQWPAPHCPLRRQAAPMPAVRKVETVDREHKFQIPNIRES